MIRLIKTSGLLVIIVAAFINPQNQKINGTKSANSNSSYSYLNLNNISTVFRNNGISDIDASENEAGFVFPKGTDKTAIFISGLIWGAKIEGDDQVRIGGSTYAAGLQGGRILSSGEPENPDTAHVRIYRVRPDVFPGGPPVDLSPEAIDEGKSETEIRAQYELDWVEWRAIDGAPFTDVDNDGVYNAAIDIPGIPGAQQTIWFVANDQDPTLTQDLFGTLPLGIEYQATYWIYNNDTYVDNIIFRKYKLINKTEVIGDPEIFKDMYISMWSDPDVGWGLDDFAGCDTTLDLSYTYNACESDAVYDPYPPPAVGFSILRGPSISSNNYMPMTAFYYYKTFYSYYWWWHLKADQIYNLMQGKIGLTGEFWMNPVTLQPTTFPLSGNPATHEGWIDSISEGPEERRIGSSSGPFQMEPGDTQEVVIAEIAALGTDRLHSIKLLKYYSALVRNAFYDDLDFITSPRPSVPDVSVDDADRITILNWGENSSLLDSIENFNSEGYSFQGYNIYQLPYDQPIFENAIKVATFDIIDGIKEIQGTVMDPETGLPINGIKQAGSDSGIKRSFSTNYDYIENEIMRVGKKYYYAVTAYTYNPYPENNQYSSESTIEIIEAEYFEALPGAKYGEDIAVNHLTGIGDGEIFVSIDDPTKLTGDDYKVTFHGQAQIRNENGDWVAGSEIIRKINLDDPDTLTGTTIDITAVYGSTAGTVELQFYLDVVHHYYGWVDGVTLTFPDGIEIVDVPPIFVSGSDTNPEPVEISGNVVGIGVTDNSQTQAGHFREGGEEWVIIVAGNSFSFPLAVDWIAHDDGYAGGQNETGTTILSEIGYATRFAELWNLHDVSTGAIVLQDNSIIDRIDYFPPRDDAPTMVENPIVDGFQITVDVSFDPPIEFSSLDLNSPSGLTTLSSNSFSDNLDIQNYTIFGGVISSKAIDNFNVGTDDLNMLEQDYELRFTGIYDSMYIGNQKVYYVKSGGQMATVFRMSSGSALADHPLNPNPGVAEPFLLRIPFEVWNVEDPDNEFQVNLTFRDRVRYGDEDPFWTWNPTNRMYSIIVNSLYDSTQVIQVDDGPDEFNAPATWVLVHYGTNYHSGDVVRIYYKGPIQFGIDEFTFTTPAPVDTTTRVTPITDYKLFQNYPNPFNPETTIRFEIPEPGIVTLDIYDILGQRVTRLLNRELASDSYEVKFKGSYLASGVYFYTLNVKDKFFEAKKMLLVK